MGHIHASNENKKVFPKPTVVGLHRIVCKLAGVVMFCAAGKNEVVF